jgi:hypothetical protein
MVNNFTNIYKTNNHLSLKESLKPITNMAWVRARLCKLQKGCTWLTATSDKVYQLLADGRWFSPGTLVSSTNKTDLRDITEILLKVALNTITITPNSYACIGSYKSNYYTITTTTVSIVQKTTIPLTKTKQILEEENNTSATRSWSGSNCFH